MHTIINTTYIMMHIKKNIMLYEIKKLLADGARPANMSGDIIDKKSQLDLRTFSVGVPIVGSMVST